MIKKWCRLHPNDYSGFSLLFTLLRLDTLVDWEAHKEWLASLMELYPARPALLTHQNAINSLNLSCSNQ